MRIGIAADHAGFEQKQHLVKQLNEAGYQVKDYGAETLDPEDDYPDIIVPLGLAVSGGEVDKGIALCGSGVGVSVVANKIPGVRAALITDAYSAHQGVEHDDMNIMCIGARVIGPLLIWELVITFIQASFIKGEVRFQRRLDKLISLEKRMIR